MPRKPQRIQLKRTKGWRKPEGAVVVSRPSKWGNPFRAVPAAVVAEHYPLGWVFDVHLSQYTSYGSFASVEACIDMYRFWFLHSPESENLRSQLDVLRGKDLCCFCGLDKPCHADVLLELVN